MKVFRPVYVEKCAVCGKECDRLHMHEVFTSRIRYICPECYVLGDKEMQALGNAKRKFKAPQRSEDKTSSRKY